MWLNAGDRNTKYFHRKASQRKEHNSIRRLKDNGGGWHFEEHEIVHILNSHFQDIFSASTLENVEEKGAIWRVGNGSRIHIWEYRWLPYNTCGRVLSERLPNNSCSLVSNLIDHDTHLWDKEIFCSMFLPVEATEILSIPLSWSNMEDKLIWPLEKHNNFSVRSAYHFIHENCMRLLASASTCGISWYKIWCLSVSPKAVWLHSPLGFHPAVNSVDEFYDWLFDRLAKENLEILGWIVVVCWEICFCRNELVFSATHYLPMTLASHAYNFLVEFHSSNPKPNVISVSRIVKWKPPLGSHFKLNVDAARFSVSEWTLGIAIRNSIGQLMLSAAPRISAPPDPTLAEALALRWGLQLATHLGFQEIEVETDCLSLVNIWNDGSNASTLHLIMQDCKNLSHSFQHFQLGHTCRDGNRLAHYIVKDYHNPVSVICFDSFPNSVLSIVQDDVLGSDL
ncbi:reverse transcriptase [Senna tora]|uniref:Reverse transcriptase n=1 Tax=Senna tora TaxID=362788 RepID=A0A834X6V1_9FABA|nr:reverse transcriptase [Senna tora]